MSADPIDDLCAMLWKHARSHSTGLARDAADALQRLRSDLTMARDLRGMADATIEKLLAERDVLRGRAKALEAEREQWQQICIDDARDRDKLIAERDVYMSDVDSLRDVLTFGAEHGTAWHEAVRALATERDVLAAIVRAAIPALEIGADAAHEVAERFHLEMKGYREHEHNARDADVATVRRALEMSRAQWEGK